MKEPKANASKPGKLDENRTHCDRCSKEAKIFLGYGPHRFCKEHFNHFFEKRVRKNIRMNKLINYGEKICVGVSGGKDSMVTLHLLNKIFGKTGQNKLEAILIDEGISGYRERSMQIGIDYCKASKIPFHTVSFSEELGVDMEKIMKKISTNPKLGSTCSYCGVFRRHFLNKKALEVKADKIATGHNLDDEVQSIAMNLFNNELAKLSRLGETTGEKKKGFVPRIKPLYDTPEKEIIAYASFNEIKHYSEECCPYSWMAKRNQYRKLINELEEAIPGTKYSLLASFRELKPLLKLENKKTKTIQECAKCGNPSNSKICSVCSQLEKIAEGAKTGNAKTSRKKKAPTCAETKRM